MVTVSQLVVTYQSNGSCLIRWMQDPPSTVTIAVDGIVKQTLSGVFGYNQTTLSGISQITQHTFCVT